MLARRSEQGADQDVLAQLADLLDDDRQRAEVAWRHGHRAVRMADWAAQEHEARQALAWATRAGDDGLRLHALRGGAKPCRAGAGD